MWQHLTIPHTGLTFILGMASATQWIQNSQVRWWSLNFSHLQLSFKTRHLHSFACAPSPTLRNAFHLCESICLFDVVKARTTAHAGVVFITTKTVNLASFLFFPFFFFFLLPTVALLSNILGGGGGWKRTCCERLQSYTVLNVEIQLEFTHCVGTTVYCHKHRGFYTRTLTLYLCIPTYINRLVSKAIWSRMPWYESITFCFFICLFTLFA